MFLFVFVCLFVFSCSSESARAPGVVARVNNYILTKEALSQLVGDGFTDSNALLHATNAWVEKRLLHDAAVNLGLKKDKKLTKQRDAFYEDLLVSSYVRVKTESRAPVLKKEISPTVIELKKLFNRERPSVVAKSFNIDWVGDDDQMSTTNSPSYPSGHTAQAYWIAYHLSDDFPVFSSHFFSLAERVAQSRVDRGVHFPSDLDGGRQLAKYLYDKKKKGWS